MNRMTADKKLLGEREDRPGGTIGNCIGTRNYTVCIYDNVERKDVSWVSRMPLGKKWKGTSKRKRER